MRIIKLVYIPALILGLFACAGGSDQGNTSTETEASAKVAEVEKEVNPMDNKGVGVIKSLSLGELDQAMADKGKEVYDAKCTACHKVTEKYIGPAPAGIMERRSPEWVMNMILDPELMVKEDHIAKDLLKEYIAPMANQNLTEEEARQILEYFRTL